MTSEQIVDAYRQTGSVWKAAKRLGIVGQSVWERLKALDYPMPSRKWTVEEIAELRALVAQCDLADIARRLGRPYYGVAIMASRLGIATRYGNRVAKKPPRGSGFTKESTPVLRRQLEAFDGSIRQFCRARGFSIDSLAIALQTYEPAFWEQQARARGFDPKTCPNCCREFYPMTPKQATCSRQCQATHRRDQAYFGGKRKNTVGLKEGVCQLCLRPRPKGLSSHHVLGKENDPDNDVLVALCQGCHSIVGRLAMLKMADDPRAWERLIELVMARRLADKKGEHVGTYVEVDLEYLTPTECVDLGLLEESHAQPTVV